MLSISCNWLWNAWTIYLYGHPAVSVKVWGDCEQEEHSTISSSSSTNSRWTYLFCLWQSHGRAAGYSGVSARGINSEWDDIPPHPPPSSQHSLHPWVTAQTASPVFMGSSRLGSQIIVPGWLAKSNAVHAAVKPCVSIHSWSVNVSISGNSIPFFLQSLLPLTRVFAATCPLGVCSRSTMQLRDECCGAHLCLI